MKQKVYLVTFALILILLVGSFERALACACGATSPCQAYYKADLVFIGKAVSSQKKRVKIKIFDDKEFKDKEIESEVDNFDFEITEVFNNGEKISKIALAGDSTTCDFPFKVDETYLVFAYKNDQNEYSTSTCSHTSKLSDAEKDLKFLREVLPLPNVEVCPYNSANSYTRSNLLLINNLLRL